MGVDLVAQRPDLGRLRRAFRVGKAPLGAERLRLGQHGNVESAPGGEKEQQDDRRIGRNAQLLVWREMTDAWPGHDERPSIRPLDCRLVADFGNVVPLFRHIVELVVRLVLIAVGGDEKARQRSGRNE